MKFTLYKKPCLKADKSKKRIGTIKTPHGEIKTPFFMPVGTVGSVKGVSPEELKNLGAQIILSNTYHLYLRPGEKLIKKIGGLHQFLRWDRPILTDSGGYQVFSLGSRGEGRKSLVKITEDGVEFQSHLDGSKHMFTPEKVIQIQLDLGVDILMPLDVCPSGKASKAEVEEAVELTIKWAKRSKEYFDCQMDKLLNCHTDKKNSIAVKPYNNTISLGLFGIVQGGLDPKLRKYCAKKLIELDFDGYSVGGLAVDHETRDMWKTVKLMGEILPENKPRYLMGVGTPDDIRKAISLGIDMFDCVLPTRLARHGSVFVYKNADNNRQEICLSAGSDNGKKVLNSNKRNNNKIVKQYNNEFELINLLNSKYRNDKEVIELGCQCPACAGGFSRAYISHLIRSNEILGLRLATLHNLHTYLSLIN